jgi:pantoate--beta-alanine ligase
MPYPEPQNIHIIPTARDPTDNLALSSRNSYLSANGRRFASALPQALEAARGAWDAGASKAQAIQAALDHVNYRHTEAVRSEGLVDDVKVDYIQFNDPESFDELPNDSTTQKNRTVILSGALWVGKTRLIDNIILGDSSRILNSRPVRWEAMLAEGISPSSEYNPATGLRNGELY